MSGAKYIMYNACNITHLFRSNQFPDAYYQSFGSFCQLFLYLAMYDNFFSLYITDYLHFSHYLVILSIIFKNKLLCLFHGVKVIICRMGNVIRIYDKI